LLTANPADFFPVDVTVCTIDAMKKLQLISSAMAVSLLVLSAIALAKLLSTAGRGGQTNRAFPPSPQRPMRYTFRLFKAAAQSLAYLPAMERAVAETSPERLAVRRLFAESQVKLTGAGPLQIGMTLEEAADELAIPLIPLGTNLSGECSYYQLDTTAQALGLMVVDDLIIRLDIWPGSTLATVSEVAIGSTEEFVKEQYPGQIEETPNPYTDGKYLTFIPNDPELSLYRLVFETDNAGKVVQYRTGQFPAVTWPDGCV
jgi:hypothetical protein